MRTDDVCALVLDACHLLETADRLEGSEALVAAEHLRALLCDAVAGCADEAVAEDGRNAICELDALVSRLLGAPTAVAQAA